MFNMREWDRPLVYTAVLVIYMTERLELGRDMATILFHCFSALAYISPLFGAILADSYYGRYK